MRAHDNHFFKVILMSGEEFRIFPKGPWFMTGKPLIQKSE